ncbi:hypothetical protein [Arthrobacter sp. C152]
MMHGLTFSGNLFFDPLATNLAPKLAAAPAAAGAQDPDAVPAAAASPAPARKRGVQTAAEHKALRAASLSKVSNELERMLRERRR